MKSSKIWRPFRDAGALLMALALLRCGARAPAPPTADELKRREETNRKSLYEALSRTRSATAERQGFEQGGVEALDPAGFQRAALLCTREAKRVIRYDVSLDGGGKPRRVEIRDGSGIRACDEALTSALMQSRWRACKQHGVAVECTFQGVLTLPGPDHRPAAPER